MIKPSSRIPVDTVFNNSYISSRIFTSKFQSIWPLKAFQLHFTGAQNEAGNSLIKTSKKCNSTVLNKAKFPGCKCYNLPGYLAKESKYGQLYSQSPPQRQWWEPKTLAYLPHYRPFITLFTSCDNSQFKDKQTTLPKTYEISGFHIPVPFLTQASMTRSNPLEEKTRNHQTKTHTWTAKC